VPIEPLIWAAAQADARTGVIMTTATSIVTAEELVRMADDDQRCELLGGALRTMAPAGQKHGRSS
jgi:hypothetical protein